MYGGCKNTMESEFSKDGAYFAILGTDGKLKIWETSTSTLKHEYTPSLHLNQPCTCLKWIQISSNQSPWRKRKRSDSDVQFSQCIALGTRSGSILIYSPFESKILTTLGSDETAAVNNIDCLTWSMRSGLISCGNRHFFRWNIADGSVKTKWKDNKNETVYSALVLESKPYLLTACRNIKLWNYDRKEIIQEFTGHTSDVKFLKYVPTNDDDSNGYFISGAKTDRFLNCWSLNENSNNQNAIARFIMEDVANNISLVTSDSGSMNMAATTQNGVVHIYRQTLNGKCTKPLKPKVTLQIAVGDDTKNKEIGKIPILTSFMDDENSVLIGYGAYHVTVFEKITISTFEKLQCLVRSDPRKLKIQSTENASKTKIPETEKNIQYLAPNNLNSSKISTKRKIDQDKSYEVPMEKRLENLVLNLPDSNTGPKSNNVANLLVQGLHSKDKHILQTVFANKDENIVRNTVKRLPVQVLSSLISELTSLIQGKTMWSQSGTIWLKHVVQIHASQLLANPELSALINPTLGLITHRMNLLPSISRLRGRLELLVTQISSSNEEDNFEQAALVYQDPDSSDSGSDDNIEMNDQSDSDDQWDENEMNDDDDDGNSSNEDDNNEDDGNSSNGDDGNNEDDDNSDIEMVDLTNNKGNDDDGTSSDD